MEELLVIFGGVVAIVWLNLQYGMKRRQATGLSPEERTQLHALVEQADKMADRIESLEKILDAESPDWREKHGSE